MTDLTNSIRQVAKSLLSEDKIQAILGFEESTLPFKWSVIIIRKVEDIDRLIWNESVILNLTSFLPKFNKEEKIGIFLRNCEIKTFNVLLDENQIKRDNFLIIGVPCQFGKLDIIKLQNQMGGKEILSYQIENEEIILQGRNKKVSLPIKENLSGTCFYCKEKAPTSEMADILIDFPETGEVPFYSAAEAFTDVIDFEKLNAEERWDYIVKELEKCNRCYACRNACSLCYCEVCFVDENQPQWFSKLVNLPETVLYHLTRALHLAGRCIDCGTCTSVCPEGVDIHVIYKKLQQAVKERWGYQAGVKIDNKNPLGTYSLDDPQEFIVKED